MSSQLSTRRSWNTYVYLDVSAHHPLHKQEQSRCHSNHFPKKLQKFNNCNTSGFIPRLDCEGRNGKMRNSYTINYEDISHTFISPFISSDLNNFTELIEYNVSAR